MANTATRPVLLRIRQAAAYVGCTEKWLRNRVAEKSIRYVKLGKLLFFRIDDLDALITASTVEPIFDDGRPSPSRRSHLPSKSTRTRAGKR